MTKIIKYIIGIISLVILLLLAVPFFISIDTYKDTIASQVKKHTGRDLIIDGKISLNMLPIPQVKLEKLRLSSVPGAKAKNLLEAKAISGKLDLSHLLRGKIFISNIDLINPVINLESLKSGKNSWEFEGANGAGDGAQPMSKKESDSSFVISNINIQDGRLNYISANNKLGIDHINIKSSLDNGVLKVKSLTGNLYDGKLKASGSLSSKGTKPIALNLSLENAQIHTLAPKGRMIKLTDGDVDIYCDIKSYGPLTSDYMKNMDGSLKLKGRNGIVSGIDLHKFVQALQKPKDMGMLANRLAGAVGRGQTEFSDLEGDIAISKGIMNIKRLGLISNEMSMASKGHINLKNLTLDVYSTVNSGIKRMPPITIHFYGPIDSPEHKIDVKAIWQHMLKTGLIGVIEKLKQGKVRPEELLKGFFR